MRHLISKDLAFRRSAPDVLLDALFLLLRGHEGIVNRTERGVERQKHSDALLVVLVCGILVGRNGFGEDCDRTFSEFCALTMIIAQYSLVEARNRIFMIKGEAIA